MHERLTDQEQQTIATAAAWLSRALQDVDHAQSNQTRLIRLFQGSTLELDQFMTTVRQSYSTTIHKLAGIRKPCAYFFRVLESLLNEPVTKTGCPF